MSSENHEAMETNLSHDPKVSTESSQTMDTAVPLVVMNNGTVGTFQPGTCGG
jgi:hypothetical protein